MKLYVVLGHTDYEGSEFYAVRRDRAQAEDDHALLERLRRHSGTHEEWCADYAELKRRFGSGACSSGEHEVREVEVPGVVHEDAAEEAVRRAHDAVVKAWDRERDLRASVPG